MDVLLLHGFTHTGRSWERVVGQLPSGYKATPPDLRGHGGASDRRPVSLAAVLGDLSALTDEPMILGGYSQGGRIALHAALDPRIGPRIRRLVLIGASPGLADEAARAERRAADEALADEFKTLTIEQLAVRWEQTPVLAGLPDEILEEVRADRRRNTPAGLAAALRGLGTGALPSLWERLREITAPVQLIAGERDGKFREIADRMAERLPRAEVLIAPGAGHAVQLECPDLVARALIGAAP